MIYAPIWRDTIFRTNVSESPLSYYITVNENDGSGAQYEKEIFRGKAYAKPEGQYLEIYVNKLCQNYLGNDITDFISRPSTTQNNSNASRVFKLYSQSGSLLESYRFIYDWSYMERDLTRDCLLSCPVNGHYDPRMLQLMTYFESNDDSVRNSKFNNPTFDDEPLYDVPSCGDYALYYLNGAGWDSFLIEGKVIRKDKYERHYITTNYVNTTLQFEKTNFNNQSVGSYELHTGLLSDAESDRLARNLFRSTTVYLHDLKENRIMPVLITDTSVDYKNHRNTKLVSYTINVDCSQTKQII